MRGEERPTQWQHTLLLIQIKSSKLLVFWRYGRAGVRPKVLSMPGCHPNPDQARPSCTTLPDPGRYMQVPVGRQSPPLPINGPRQWSTGGTTTETGRGFDSLSPWRRKDLPLQDRYKEKQDFRSRPPILDQRVGLCGKLFVFCFPSRVKNPHPLHTLLLLDLSSRS